MFKEKLRLWMTMIDNCPCGIISGDLYKQEEED